MTLNLESVNFILIYFQMAMLGGDFGAIAAF